MAFETWKFGVGMTKNIRWSDAETEELLNLMKSHGRNFDAIGRIMKKTPDACEHRWRWTRLTDDQRRRRNERERVRRSITRGVYVGVKEQGNPVRAIAVPDEVLNDRAIRLATPRTLTSQFFGDPPPGYSALDRKRQGIAEPVYIDNRRAQLQRRPSLAGTAQ